MVLLRVDCGNGSGFGMMVAGTTCVCCWVHRCSKVGVRLVLGLVMLGTLCDCSNGQVCWWWPCAAIEAVSVVVLKTWHSDRRGLVWW